MNDEIRLMKMSHEFQISMIKSQLLADITIKIIEKYDFVTRRDIEEIAITVRHIVASVFGEQNAMRKEASDD